MIWNPFARWGPDVNALALKQNLKMYVNAYTNVRNKNNMSALPPINTKIVNALKRYINSKRPKAAGAAAAAVNNAGGNNANAAAAAAGVTRGNGSTPNAVANAAVKPLLALGAPPVQVAAAAAGAAKQQALALGMSSNAANNVGARAAANAARAARPNATPAQSANTAAAGAAAAGLPSNNQAKAAEEASNEAEGVSAANRSNAQVAMNKINGMLRRPLPAALSAATANALRRQLNSSVALAREGGLVSANKNREITNYRARINAKLPTTGNETGKVAPLEVNINVPGSNTKVKVKRNNPGSNWYFANSANNTRYNLNNRNQNVPKVRNVGSGNLFKQGN